MAAKHYRGICKKGETYMELCEGCGDFVELDHTGWRVGTVAHNKEIICEENSFLCRGLGFFSNWLRRFRP